MAEAIWVEYKINYEDAQVPQKDPGERAYENVKKELGLATAGEYPYEPGMLDKELVKQCMTLVSLRKTKEIMLIWLNGMKIILKMDEKVWKELQRLKSV